jgi:multidrug efflux system outer membrane protein
VKRLVTILGVAATLAGCNLAPPYVRPAPPIPGAWPQGPSYAAPQAGANAADVSWRTFFTDPKLQAIVAQALSQNRSLRVAIANIEAARAQFRIQRADLLPTVAGSASASYTRGAGVTERLYSASIGLSAYEFDVFGRVRNLSRAALEQYLATEEARRSVQTSIIAEVATDYLTLASDRQLLAVAQQTLASQQASLALTRARFNAGEASQLDVEQANTTVQQARADVAQFTTQAAQDKNALDLVVGATVPDSELPTGLQPPMGVTTALPAGSSSLVLLQRPDVLQSEHQLRAANADIGAARANFFPTISLTAAAGLSSPALSGLFNARSGAWTFAPGLSIPIFDAGRNRANLRYSQAQRDIAVANYENAIQTAFREVADALARRGTIAEQLAAEQSLVDSAATSLRLSTARYERGTDPYLNVLVAQQTLYSAQRTLVQTQLIELTNAVSLYRALGGGVQ